MFFVDELLQASIKDFLVTERNAARFILSGSLRICTLRTAPDTTILIARGAASEDMTVIYARHSDEVNFSATIERDPLAPVLRVDSLAHEAVCEPYDTNPQHPLVQRDVDELTRQLMPLQTADSR